jgi:hypothetical protein
MPEPTLPTPQASDVFVSYAREDRGVAQSMAAALADAGFGVWWDRQLAGGQDFADVIDAQLAAARKVLVLWSAASVKSGFVRDEAARARDAGKLVPVRIEDVRLPLGFGAIHTPDLLGWDGDRDDPAWQALVADLRRAAGAAVERVPEPAPPPWRRWRRALAMLTGAAVLAGAGWWGLDAWHDQQAVAQAQEQLQAGLAAHFARDRNLQVARNAYLSALRADPGLGRAHYYLGHVYALLMLPRDAREQFELALRFAADLDSAQRDDARVQLAALRSDEGVVALTRAVPAEAPPSPAPPPAAAQPAPPAPVGSDPRRPARVEAAAAPRLPRVAPSPEQQRAIDAQVAALFAPEAQARLQAATTLALDPGLAADALPLAIDRSLAALRDTPVGEAQAAGASNTLQLALAASPATLGANAEAALRLADAAAALGTNQRAGAEQLRALVRQSRSTKPPLVYLQIADAAQHTIAAALAERLRAAGYAVPAVEVVGARAPMRSEVRVQGGSSPGWGRWLAKVVGEVTGEPARLATLRSARPGNDTYEIWLDKDLCLTRRVSGC